MAKQQEATSGLAGFASRMGDSLDPNTAAPPLDEVEPEDGVAAAKKAFDMDAYLDADDKTKKRISDDLSPYWDAEGVRVSYQGIEFRLRRGVPASIAFSGTVSVGDQTELALLVKKSDRVIFAEALVDDDRFLLTARDATEVEKNAEASPAVRTWIAARSIMQALAMGRDPKG